MKKNETIRTHAYVTPKPGGNGCEGKQSNGTSDHMSRWHATVMRLKRNGTTGKNWKQHGLAEGSHWICGLIQIQISSILLTLPILIQKSLSGMSGLIRFQRGNVAMVHADGAYKKQDHL